MYRHSHYYSGYVKRTQFWKQEHNPKSHPTGRVYDTNSHLWSSVFSLWYRRMSINGDQS